ncbi:fire blight resistance locus LG12 [Pyrus ussuriensis x Pyrus communis]|uniref:Fire blight resistance locus LG12 n=1 Tax=Pyrus ussuriensis x Pyrus communis TaxID=2448454 RepID=A0A5N5G738_9ROSA|nr:fire blight resistance locus LG12 [Pyrus ussuriensis x Pyrus communis]
MAAPSGFFPEVPAGGFSGMLAGVGFDVDLSRIFGSDGGFQGGGSQGEGSQAERSRRRSSADSKFDFSSVFPLPVMAYIVVVGVHFEEFGTKSEKEVTPKRRMLPIIGKEKNSVAAVVLELRRKEVADEKEEGASVVRDVDGEENYLQK